MNAYVRMGILFGCLLMSCFCWETQAGNSTRPLSLLGRSEVQGYQVSLSGEDWKWLRENPQLVLGVTVQGTAPFELSTDGGEYEGLIADYAALLGQLLRVRVDVRQFASREEAVAALTQGQVDLLAIGRDTEEGDASLTLSRPYADTAQVLVSRDGAEDLSRSDLSDKRIAAAEFYWTRQELESLYPNASIQMYPSVQTAIGAVAFDRADVYLGEAITASYRLNKSYLNDLQMVPLAIRHGQHFSFVMSSQNWRLHNIVNLALESIPLAERLVILRRWSAGAEGLRRQYFLSHSLSHSERLWLAKHPRMKVAANLNYMPISFQDGRHVYRGISADVLAKVAQHTGLRFDPVYADTVDGLAELVKSGEADFLAAFTKNTEREEYLMSTRPYLTEPVVLVIRSAEKSVNSLADLKGKKLAVIHGNAQSEFVRMYFSDVQQVVTQSIPTALALLRSGKVDAAIGDMTNVDYQIAQNYKTQLQVVATVDNVWSRTAFATRRDSPELLSILNKALLSISPEEMDELTSRWRGGLVIGDSYWVQHRDLLTRIITAGVLALGIILGWAGYLGQLVHKRKQAEQALSEQVQFLRVLIDGIPHPIYVRDRVGRLLICNAGYLKAFNISRDAVVGKRLTEVHLLGPEKAADIESVYQQVMTQGQAWTSDRTINFADGRSFTIYHWVFPYRGSDNRIVGVISGWIDISERQRLLNQLQAAKDEAEIANRAKTTFLAIMSHEIRTPMNAVIGMLELMLKKSSANTADRTSMEIAAGAAKELHNLVGDILDVVRIESGQLSLTPSGVFLHEVVGSVMRMFSGGARLKGVHLSLHFDPAADQYVLLDALRFKQVLSNLVSNALKFTFEGSVLLIVQVLPATDEGRLVLSIRIKDTGIGISAEDQRKLFSPFTQASNNPQSGRSGSGLGLVISRNLCEMMGGSLELNSVLGAGTLVKVMLVLPILCPPLLPGLPITEDHSLIKSLNILVVDDYAANRELLRQQLEFLGHRVVDAEDGAQGLSAWRRGHFDVVITDISMPVMTGGDLVRMIRHEERIGGIASCRIYGFTAHALPATKVSCLEAGMDDCLFKPLTLMDLSSRLGTAADLAHDISLALDTPLQASKIDFSGIEQMARGDLAAVSCLLVKLATSNHDDRHELGPLLQAYDLKGLATLAHRVMGGARMVRHQALINACERLESACEMQEETAVRMAVDTLEHEMLHLSEALAPRL